MKSGEAVGRAQHRLLGVLAGIRYDVECPVVVRLEPNAGAGQLLLVKGVQQREIFRT